MTKKLKIIIFIILGIIAISFVVYKIPFSENQESQPLNESFLPEKKILEKLTFDQKIGQLFLIGFEGKSLTPEIENLMKEVRPGGILLLKRNISDKEQLKNLINNLQEISLKDSGLPLFIAIDQEGG